MVGADEGREIGERGYLPGLGVYSYSNKNMHSSLSSSAQLAWYLGGPNLDVSLVGIVREREERIKGGREERRRMHIL